MVLQRQEYASCIARGEQKYAELKRKCGYRREEIGKINPNFVNCLQEERIQEGSL